MYNVNEPFRKLLRSSASAWLQVTSSKITQSPFAALQLFSITDWSMMGVFETNRRKTTCRQLLTWKSESNHSLFLMSFSSFRMREDSCSGVGVLKDREGPLSAPEGGVGNLCLKRSNMLLCSLRFRPCTSTQCENNNMFTGAGYLIQYNTSSVFDLIKKQKVTWDRHRERNFIHLIWGHLSKDEYKPKKVFLNTFLM